MRSLLVMVLVIFTCGTLAKGKKSDEKVKIAVYYEALCPDSKQFITQQLAPVWMDLRGSVKVKLVPYGKATHDKVNGKWKFTCHHGPDECYANKIQACILKDRKLVDTDKVELVVCLMSQPNPDKSLDSCLNDLKQPKGELSRLRHCIEEEQADNLLASYGDKTDALMKPLSFVPTVVINEKFDQKIQDDALSNLRAVVCRVATKKPVACQET